MRLFAISSLLISAAMSMAQGLNIGDQAPELKVTDWVKGNAQELGKGNITVVEFWATWCGPCKMSIPHLTELAHKYKGKVNFVGVSIWESKPEDYKTKVPAFVKDFGDKMDYNVATEGPDTFMAQNWMQAAGENGIPCAFLIDKDGKIAWIGHPMSGLDEAISGLLDGKLDTAKARDDRAKSKAGEMEQQKKQQELTSKLQPVMSALRAKEFKKASDEADKLMGDAELKPYLINYKLVAMVQGKVSGLDKFLLSLGKEDSVAKEPMALNQVIWTVVENDMKFDKGVYAACVKLGKQMMELAPDDAMNMDTYALALWRSGDKKKALATQKKAVELASANKEIPEDTVKEMKDRLKEFGG